MFMTMFLTYLFLKLFNKYKHSKLPFFIVLFNICRTRCWASFYSCGGIRIPHCLNKFHPRGWSIKYLLWLKKKKKTSLLEYSYILKDQVKADLINIFLSYGHVISFVGKFPTGFFDISQKLT